MKNLLLLMTACYLAAGAGLIIISGVFMVDMAHLFHGSARFLWIMWSLFWVATWAQLTVKWVSAPLMAIKQLDAQRNGRG